MSNINKIAISLLITALFANGTSIDQKYYKLTDAEQTKNMLLSMFSSGDLVFDVGANKGFKTREYLACGARVVCVEPQPVCVNILYEKYGNNEDVAIEPVGLADKEGVLKMYHPHHHDSSVLATFSKDWVDEGRFSHLNWEEGVEVEVTTLENIVKKYGIPQFCKIDVEDFEHEVLLGLQTPIPYVSFECHHETMDKSRRCIDRLIELGYKSFNIAIATSDRFWFDQWVPAEDFYKALEDIDAMDWSVIKKLWGDIYASYE
ncbi:MAG: FkbM family methyltransferase [Candidatus Dependentiae bacterium]